MSKIRTYRGCNIYRTRPRAMVKWESYVCGRFVCADTLDGMRRIIGETIERESRP